MGAEISQICGRNSVGENDCQNLLGIRKGTSGTSCGWYSLTTQESKCPIQIKSESGIGVEMENRLRSKILKPNDFNGLS